MSNNTLLPFQPDPMVLVRFAVHHASGPNLDDIAVSIGHAANPIETGASEQGAGGWGGRSLT
jgi:hypothetical protein